MYIPILEPILVGIGMFTGGTIWIYDFDPRLGEKQPHGGSAQITLSGPASGWFGAGFNAEAMADSPYTLVVNDAGGETS